MSDNAEAMIKIAAWIDSYPDASGVLPMVAISRERDDDGAVFYVATLAEERARGEIVELAQVSRPTLAEAATVALEHARRRLS